MRSALHNFAVAHRSRPTTQRLYWIVLSSYGAPKSLHRRWFLEHAANDAFQETVAELAAAEDFDAAMLYDRDPLEHQRQPIALARPAR